MPMGVPTLKSTKVGRGEEKTFDSFPLSWCKPDICILNTFQDIHFLFGYMSSRHTVLDLEFHLFVLFVFL